MDELFYENGLSFECQQCSNCCRHDPGFVFLSQDDINTLLNKIQMKLDDFLKTYCRKVSINGFERVSLKEKSNYDCIFWENGGCIQYDARPLQCRSYPFWTPYLASESDWNSLNESCQGINKGKLHSKEEIEKWVRIKFNNPLIEDFPQ